MKNFGRVHQASVNNIFKKVTFKTIFWLSVLKSIQARVIYSFGCGAGPEIAAYFHYVRHDLECDDLDLKFIAVDPVQGWKTYLDKLTLDSHAKIEFKVKF